MKKILVITMAVIFMCNFILSYSIYANDDANENEVNENEINALSAILYDKVTGRVLWEKNAYEKRAMASTTKIMTCIVALEHANLDDIITVSNLAARAPEVKLHIKENEEYVLEDFLYALMLVSSNDVAVALAEGISGSVESYCDLMTAKARKIGAINTSYKTPNGLDAEDHYSTAYDLALITKYALENEKFYDIINTPSYSFNELTTGRALTVNNKNSFLNMFEGANGVKTGFTNNAGLCFVGSVKQDDMELIAVILASGWPPNKTYRWADTKRLMNYGFENYNYQTLLDVNGIAVKFDDLAYAIEDEVCGIITKDVKLICKTNEKVDVIYQYRPIDEAPVNKDELIGKAIIYIDGAYYTSVDIIASSDVHRIDFNYCLHYIMDKFLTFIVKS